MCLHELQLAMKRSLGCITIIGIDTVPYFWNEITNWSLMWWDESLWIRFQTKEKEWEMKKRVEEIKKSRNVWLITHIRLYKHSCIPLGIVGGYQPNISAAPCLFWIITAWLCFTFVHFLASYKACVLFYYPLQNLQDILHRSREHFLLFSQLRMCVIFFSSFFFEYPSLVMYDSNKTKYKYKSIYYMWEFAQKCFKFLIDKNVMRNVFIKCYVIILREC